VQENRARAGQILGNDRIENRARDAALDHDFSKPGLLRERFIIVEWIAIT
jgi:hypothetical protein